MINSLQNNNFYPSFLNKAVSCYQKPLNLKSCQTDTISFSGKSFVVQELFGKNDGIPKLVDSVKQCSKNLFMFNNQRRLMGLGNCVYLGDNYFLTAGHCCPEDAKFFGIGKLSKKGVVPVDSITLASSGLDLAIIHCKSKLYSKAVPIKIAKSIPAKPEIVYITGQNLELESTKAIPSIYIGKKSWFNNLRPVKNIINETFDKYLSKIGSSILIDHYKESAGLSGSPILNKNGELIGILSSSNRAYSEMQNFLIPDIDAIKPFLEAHNIKYNAA